MKKRRLLDYDRETGVETWHTYDHHTKVTEILTKQVVDPYLRVNQAHMNRDTATSGGLNSVSRKQIKDSWWHVACIPTGVQEMWLRTKGIDIYKRSHWPRVKRLLNDPDWRYLRSNPGRV